MPWGIINLQLLDNANELEILLYTILTMSLVQIRDHSGFNKFIWIYAYKPLYVALALHVHIYMHLFPKEAIQSCSGKQAQRFLELKNNTCNYHGNWVTYQIFKKRGAWQDLNFYKGLDGNEGGDLFQGGCSVYIKNKLKAEMFVDKKSLYTKVFFSAITKNSNSEILSKNCYF